MSKKSPLETDIFNYHTPEFFINMKNIPDKASKERGSFISEERRKCREGININGIFIPPGLYTHLNYYNLEGDDKDRPGKKKIMLPTLRDNEWIIFNDYHLCKEKKILYPLFGARQISKSETEVSLCLSELSLWKPTEAMALFANDAHRDTFVKKARTALQYGEKFIYRPNIDKDWGKTEIRFGLTKQDNSLDLSGTLYIYNTQEGKKIQVGSGKTLSFLLIDEAAAAPFQSIIDTLEPALLTDLGELRCAPIIAFTGGETDKAEDAKNLVESPVPEKQFITTLEDGQLIGGRFMDGRYRKDCKVQTTISKYLDKVTNTWIDDYPIMVTDFDFASEKIAREREVAAKSPNKNTLTLRKIFFPLTIAEVFLKESGNRFNKDAIDGQQRWLKDHYEPLKIDLYRDLKGEVQWKHSTLNPISIFPVKPIHDKIAPILVFEKPIPNAPFYTYCIGIDPINSDDSTDKIVSLFTVTVFKRMLNPLDEFKDEIVCTYRGRPKELVEAHQIAVMIAEYYNAIEGVLIEASEASLIQHFFLKRKGKYLANAVDLQSEIAKKRITGGKKGLMPTTTNQKHYMGLMVEYANEEILSLDDEGNETMIYGVSRIKDPMLLEEMKEYRSKITGRGIHDGNYDSIISFGCALTLAKYYDVHKPITQQIPSQKTETQQVTSKYSQTPWGVIERKPNKLFEEGDNTHKPRNPNIPSWMLKR